MDKVLPVSWSMQLMNEDENSINSTINLKKTKKITCVRNDLTFSQEFLISTITFSLLINITR